MEGESLRLDFARESAAMMRVEREIQRTSDFAVARLFIENLIHSCPRGSASPVRSRHRAGREGTPHVLRAPTDATAKRPKSVEQAFIETSLFHLR